MLINDQYIHGAVSEDDLIKFAKTIRDFCSNCDNCKVCPFCAGKNGDYLGCCLSYLSGMNEPMLMPYEWKFKESISHRTEKNRNKNSEKMII